MSKIILNQAKLEEILKNNPQIKVIESPSVSPPDTEMISPQQENKPIEPSAMKCNRVHYDDLPIEWVIIWLICAVTIVYIIFL